MALVTLHCYNYLKMCDSSACVSTIDRLLSTTSGLMGFKASLLLLQKQENRGMGGYSSQSRS